MNVRIVLDADGAFPEMAEEIAAGKVKQAKLSAVTALPAGMQSGRTSVALIGKLEDGTTVFMEVSLRVFQMAAAAFTGRYGDETGDASGVVVGDEAVLGWKGD